MKNIIQPMIFAFCIAGLSGIATLVSADTVKLPPKAQTQAATVSEVSVEQAATRIKAGAQAVDANNKKTRKEHGVIPKAIILSSASEYPVSQLPTDKSAELIFYCANTHCTASDAAAARAQTQGYKNVSLLRAGIMGWKDAGQPTQELSTVTAQ